MPRKSRDRLSLKSPLSTAYRSMRTRRPSSVRSSSEKMAASASRAGRDCSSSRLSGGGTVLLLKFCNDPLPLLRTPAYSFAQDPAKAKNDLPFPVAMCSGRMGVVKGTALGSLRIGRCSVCLPRGGQTSLTAPGLPVAVGGDPIAVDAIGIGGGVMSKNPGRSERPGCANQARPPSSDVALRRPARRRVQSIERGGLA